MSDKKREEDNKMTKKKKKLNIIDPRPHERKDNLALGGSAKEKDLTDRFCPKPWDHFEIGSGGKVHACCPSWLKTPIGNCMTSDVMSIWDGPLIQEVRKSILDGNYKFCTQQECPAIQSDSLPKKDEIKNPRLRNIIDNRVLQVEELPLLFNLCYDESCNLSCPSCRLAPINFSKKEDPEYMKRARIQEMLLQSLFSEPHDKHIIINVTGSGDPFGSKLFRLFLQAIDGKLFPNVKVSFQTNGVLFTESVWKSISNLHQNVREVIVSFDAATPETYSYTRRGGNWSKLLENMEFLSSLRKQGYMHHLAMDFVVQQKNYKEMPQYVQIAKGFKDVGSASFSLITDWGTYSEEEFKKHAIWKTDHPEFDDFLKVLRDPILADPIVRWGNVYEYRKRAIDENNKQK